MTGPQLDLTGEFWLAAAQRRLVRPVCDDCGRSFFTPSWCCPHCQSESWRYTESAGAGVIYSVTTVHQGPDPTWVVPYLLAVVDLDEGWSMLTRLVGVPPAGDADVDLIGARVAVSFTPEGREPHRTLPTFALAGGAGAQP